MVQASTVPLRSWLILAGGVTAAMLNDISGAVLNLAMPEAARDVGATTAASQFILLAGKLSLGALLLAGGGLGDRLGRKRVILVGIAVVAVASVVSGLSQTAGLLAAGRTLDGGGNALIGPLALAICVLIFPAGMRAQVIGLFLGFTGAGMIIGPFLAGILIQFGGWRIGFVAPLVLAFLGGLVIAVEVPSSPLDRQRPKMDLPGMALCIVGLTSLVLGFVLAASQGWLAAEPLSVIGLGALCMGTFAWWDLHRASHPLIDRRLLRSREVLAALAAATLMSLVVNGTVLPLLYFIQRIQGSNPVGAATRLAPLIVAALVVAPIAGRMAVRFGRRPVMAIGLLLAALGSCLLIPLTLETPYVQLLAGLVLMGAGLMTVITPAADLVMATTGTAQAGSAAALTASAIQVGGAIGIGVITSTFIGAAEKDFFARLAGLGVPAGQAATLVEALRNAVRETTLGEVPRLPEVSSELHAGLIDAYARAVAAGLDRSFVLAAVLSLAAIPFLLWVMPRRRHTQV